MTEEITFIFKMHFSANRIIYNKINLKKKKLFTMLWNK